MHKTGNMIFLMAVALVMQADWLPCFNEDVCSLSFTADTPVSSSSLEGQTSQPAEGHEDPELSSWLRLYGADQDSIDRVGLCFSLLVQELMF